MKPLRHFTHPYLLEATHPVSIAVAGAGGTGSQVITGLARVNYALMKLGHPGFNVTLYDADTVSPANIGRQLFSESEIGQNKAGVLMGRINRFFGTRWLAKPVHYTDDTFEPTNILITCVDSIAARRQCYEAYTYDLTTRRSKPRHTYLHELYWMDFGNTKSTGQFVIGSIGKAKQPEGEEYQTVAHLPNVFDLFPGFADQEEDANEPSCSLMEALSRQDLFINTTITNLGMDILFRMFREGGINHQGVFLNLPELITAKIPLTLNQK